MIDGKITVDGIESLRTSSAIRGKEEDPPSPPPWPEGQ